MRPVWEQKQRDAATPGLLEASTHTVGHGANKSVDILEGGALAALNSLCHFMNKRQVLKGNFEIRVEPRVSLLQKGLYLSAIMLSRCSK